MKKIILLIIGALLAVASGNAEGALWDGGYHEFSEGYEWEVWLLNDATGDIYGGEIGILACWDTSSVFVYEPSEIGLLRPANSSTANVYGGTINHLFALNSSETRIYGGNINGIDPDDSTIIYLYTDNYSFDPTGGIRDGGLLTGEWFGTGEAFSISLDDVGDINHITFVPEPSMMGLFVIGSLMFRAIKRKTRR
jgi:hypothetical protein